MSNDQSPRAGDESAADLIEAVEAYLEAQGALDNRELMGPNAPPYEELLRACKRAYEVLDDVLHAAKLAADPAAQIQHCMCEACKEGVIHASDCAVHNMPAMQNGPCDCGAAAPAAPTSSIGWTGNADADLAKLAEQAGMRVDLLSMGAASMVYSDGCEGVTREHLQRFAALVAAAPAVAPAGWISVADRLPPKFAEVMIAFAGSALPSTGQYTGNRRDSADGWSYPSENSGDDTDWTVTHWRPLPEHPESHRFAGSADAAALAAVPSPATGEQP